MLKLKQIKIKGGSVMTYGAKNIANFVVNYCADKGSPITNLKLQKILYFLWVDYFKQTRRELYHDNICAWRLGPVVPEVYYDFCFYAGNPIRSAGQYTIYDDDIIILQKIIDKYAYMSASTLVNMTHQQGKPWDRVYKNGEGDRDVIPFYLIKMLECAS